MNANYEVLVMTDNIQKVFELGWANKMTFVVADLKDWKLESLNWWDSTIPAEGLNRANLILESGIPVQGFYLAHEVETKPELKPWVVPEITVPDIPWKEIAKIVAVGVGVVVVVAGALGTLIFLMAAMALCSGDPAVIVKVDEVYVILYSWAEEK